MAEDHSRPYRSSESIARTGQARGPAAGSDPLAELARLIGQSDPFGDAMNASARLAESTGAPAAVDWTAPSTQPQHEQSFAPGNFSYAPAAPAGQHHAPGQNYAQAAHGYAQQGYPPQGYAQPQDADPYRIESEVPAYLTARGPAAEPPAYHPHQDRFAPEQHEYYDDVPPPRRRIGVLAVAAIFGLAVVGTAGAFGYRTLFGSAGARVPPVIAADKSPLKVVPNNAGGEGRKAIADRVANDPLEKVLSREEKPVDIAQKIAETTPAIQVNAPPLASAGNGVIAGEPKKVHTIPIRPDGTESPQAAMPSPMPPMPAAPTAPKPQAQPAPVTGSATRPAPAPKPVAEAPAARAQASANAPLSLNPNAAEPASRPVRTANAAPTPIAAPAAPSPAAAPAGHTVAYAVQVSSQKSEAEAKAAYKGIESKYAAQLGGKPMFVYRVDLGAKGVYYRTMIGPYSDAAEATELCSSLKSAGGSCIVQRN
jgi:hypothetical protein